MSVIPTFPEFRAIDISDRASIESHTHQYPPYSDFNFTSLWAWDTSGKRMISELNGNLVVLFTDYETQELFFSFLGVNEPEHTARELIEYAKTSGMSPILRLVPEESIVGMRKSVLVVKEDKNNFDYLYEIPKLATLRGSKFKGKRQIAARFERKYPNARFEIGDLSDMTIQKYIVSVLRSWGEKKKSENKKYELKYEEAAIKRLLKASDGHEIIISGVFLDDSMIGFSIDEILPNQYCIEHFSKAHNVHTGVYDFLNLKVAQHLEANNVSLWNWEQDLGIESLHRSKLSYRPVKFLKKYTISLAK